MVLIDFTQPWSHDDIILECMAENEPLEDENEPSLQKLHASRAILEMWSPVFKAMFTDGHYKEGETKKVTLPGKSYEDVLELLKVLHPTDTSVTVSNAHTLLPLAHEYQIQDIVEKCEDSILSEDVTMEDLHIADTYDLEKLKYRGIHEIVTNWTPSEIIDDPGYGQISLPLKCELLETKILDMEYRCSCFSFCPVGSIEGLTPVQQLVYDIIKGHDSEQGIGIDNLYEQVELKSSYNIRTALEHLIAEGHIYSTIDEDHFKSTECDYD